MSNVPESKRGESGYQVIDTSRRLKKKVIDACIKLPKRYTDLILIDTARDAKDVARYARKANSVYPKNRHEAQIRIDYWIRALAAVQTLSDDINDIKGIPSVLRHKDHDKEKGVTMNELDEILDLIDMEWKLLRGSLESDRERFGKLK